MIIDDPFWKIRNLAHMRRWSAIDELLTGQRERYPDYPCPFIVTGCFVEIIDGDRKKAGEFYQNALDMDTKRTKAPYIRRFKQRNYYVSLLLLYTGLFESCVGQYDNAEIAFETGLAWNPAHLFTLVEFGYFLWIFREDLAKADEYYRRALGVEPDNQLVQAECKEFSEFLAKLGSLGETNSNSDGLRRF